MLRAAAMRRSFTLVLASLSLVAAVRTQSWTLLSPPTSPSTRYHASLVHDPLRDRLVLLSGTAVGTTGIPETWENDGTTWTFRGTSPSWAGTSNHATAAIWDPVRQVTVAVLGDTGTGFCQVWEWNGTVWTLRAPLTSPPSRYNFALAYDSVRDRTVLFGGLLGTEKSDTWEWDGTNWAQRGTGGPPKRQNAAMAYDSTRGVCVLFGGNTSSSLGTQWFADTWEWNGTYWLERFGVAGPAARSEHTMAFDPERSRTVLYGGRTQSGGGFSDTWEWNGTAWTSVPAGATAQIGVAMTFDAARHRMTMFGGRVLFSTVTNETRVYVPPGLPLATVNTYGSACPGPTGLPTLAAAPGSLPRLGTVFSVRLANLPSGPLNIVLVWFGFSDSVWGSVTLPFALDAFGFPQCTVLAVPDSSAVVPNILGTAVWSLTMPVLPATAGLDVFFQGAVLVSGWSVGDAVLTNGLHASLGI